MNSVFTYSSILDGKIGIGKLPIQLYDVLDNISTRYHAIIPDKSLTTYHTYYNELDESLKTAFDTIQYDPLWNGICDNPDNCIFQNVIEMNEIYYSNPKPNFRNTNLYGAAANLIPHRDCLLYDFDGISMYRVIIGLTDGNNDTITDFTNFNLHHKINRGDYMIFDFDKTVHQVIKTGQQETQRILLKLHFIVCENCKYSRDYVISRSYFYILYYVVARYTEQIGTDPTTFMGFFFGILWEWPFNPNFKYMIAALFLNIFLLMNHVCNTEYKMNDGILINAIKINNMVIYSIQSMWCIYVLVSLGYYMRYSLFGIR